ncbi:hypothetical protein ABKN59_001520 [Abortiporus biennis]
MSKYYTKRTVHFESDIASTPSSTSNVPPTQFIPLYGHPKPSCSSYSQFSRSAPPPYHEDPLMKTVDYRYVDPPPKYRRSSFALSDIFEEDEIEIEISSILPPLNSSTSSPASSICQRSTTLSRIGQKLMNFFATVKDKCQRAGTRIVMNVGTNAELDLLV